jgi:hypothetical protein
VAFDDDDFGTGDLAGVFHAGEDLVGSDIACDADAEDVAEADVEDEFGGGAGVDAAEDDGERVLGVGGAVDLADEVAVEALACDEARMTSAGEASRWTSWVLTSTYWISSATA